MFDDVDGSPPARPSVERLKEFLRDAARQTRERGIRLAIATVTPNLLLPPTGAAWRSAGAPPCASIQRCTRA